ncbi:MAG: carboxylating nicotinate-nucleotide diphosphorylase [Candidatus Zixiibacteriota bacterium]|nr:MAG: carboxylating nicotinate-nucleotide diphosphorylase [candidate division Zixibacteria bacterium]
MTELSQLVSAALREDVGEADWTTRLLLDPQTAGTAKVMAKAPGILSGLEPFVEVFRQVDDQIVVRPQCREGDRLSPGEVAVYVEGRLGGIMTGERTALNFLQRLSGIATLTARFVEAVEGTRAVILDTRKTTPGLRLLEKAAVRHGGGSNHRLGLYDMILIKDNHVAAAGGVTAALQQTRQALAHAGRNLPIEVEVQNLEQLDEALALRPDRILLDNFSLDQIRRAVETAAGRVPLEVSGGVTLEGVREVAHCGVDYISVGALTHSAPALDLSLLLMA